MSCECCVYLSKASCKFDHFEKSLRKSFAKSTSKSPFARSPFGRRAHAPLPPRPPVPPRHERPWVGDARACCASALARPLGAPNRTSPRHAATNRKGHLHTTRYTINISTRLKVMLLGPRIHVVLVGASQPTLFACSCRKYYRGKSVYKTSENRVIKILTF